MKKSGISFLVLFAFILLGIVTYGVRNPEKIHKAAGNLIQTTAKVKVRADCDMKQRFCMIFGDVVYGIGEMRQYIDDSERQGIDMIKQKQQFNELLLSFQKLEKEVPHGENCAFSLSKFEPYKLE